MQEVTIVDYDQAMLDEMMQMFYDSVHTIAAVDYNAQQLEGWAPLNSNKAWWEQRLKNNVCKVAFVDKVIAGFSELTNDGHVDTMYVHKDFQRMHVAASLLDELLKIAAERKYTALTTEASITAKPFFKKYGFEITRRKKKLYNGEQFINYKMTKLL